MKPMSWFCLVLLAAVGCESSLDPIAPKFGEEFQLRYGQSAVLKDIGLVIQFVGVEEDSRCPIDLMCVWEGNAKISLDVLRKRCSVNTSLEPKEAEHEGYRIKLLAVSPHRKRDQEIDLEDYIITLVVSQPTR